MRVGIVGGGITGLVAAYELKKRGAEVRVYEASDNLGGKIQTTPVGDRPIDSGPDAFLARASAAYELCDELGITDKLTHPVSAVPAYIHRDQQLFKLPPSVLGVPVDIDALKQNGLISEEGVERAALDLELPASTDSHQDITVGTLCRERLGDEVTDYLLDPLIGGINASDIDRLSLKAATPLLAEALERSPSLIEGVRALRQNTLGAGSANSETPHGPPPRPKPVFYGIVGGIATIIDELERRFEADELHLEHTVASISDLDEDVVVLATPAYTSAKILEADNSDSSSELLAKIDYASVAQVTLEIDRRLLDPLLDTSGILFPRAGGLTLTACTWLSAKWAHYARPNTATLRLTSGRFGDPDDTTTTRRLPSPEAAVTAQGPTQLNDEQLVATLVNDLGNVVEVSGEPTAVRIKRWPRSFPQYQVGHHELVNSIRREVRSCYGDRVLVAGAAYDGIGIPACIVSGRQAATKAFANSL